jgi:hydrogenase/urease accessory protein HupE
MWRHSSGIYPRSLRGRSLSLAIGGGICLIPAAAQAHTAVQNVGSFWSGVAHLLTSLDQLAFLLGLAIWTSFLDPRYDALMLGATFTAALIGTVLGSVAGAGFDFAMPMAALVLAAGLAGAIRLRLGAVPLLGLASAGALVLGGAGADATAGLSPGLFALGSSIAAVCVLSYGLLAARCLETEWGRIARRAGASWIAAIGLMILALSLARQTGRV